MPFNNADLIPSGARERLAAPLLRMAARIFLKPALSPTIPIAWQRRWLKQVTRAMRPRVAVDVQSGAVGGVMGEWLRPRAANADSKAAILYLHGGAYCVGSPATHRAITAHLAQAACLPVFAADYRLAPEHPFPAAVEDAVSACRSLLDMGPVAIAGDSAGAGLAVATALALRQRQLALPAALVLLSPWVDLTAPANSDEAATGEVVLSAAWLNACVRHYLASADAKAPLASPVYGDLRGLPPTLIQTGTDEILHGQALRLNDTLQKAGVVVTCETVPARWHVFQLHAGMLPSADAAIARAANFILRNVAV
jgi:acetyl esterase/lipase